MSKRITYYLEVRDFTIVDNGYYNELTWDCMLRWTHPDNTSFNRVMSFGAEKFRIEVWVHGALDRTPSEMFVKSHLKNSKQLAMYRERDGV